MIVLLALLLAAPVRAVEVKGMRVEGGAALDMAACRRNPRKVWNLVKIGFGEIFPLHLKEIEGAMPGRFLPRTLPFAEAWMTKDGRFIRMFCLEGEVRVPCPAKGRVLEERTIKATLLRALPTDVPYDDLYNPETWEITGLGNAQLARAEKCWPDLWERTALLVTALLPPKR